MNPKDPLDRAELALLVALFALGIAIVGTVMAIIRVVLLMQ